MVKYVYDAWGNHKVLDSRGWTISSSTHVGKLNPFRYRGYYYDTETKLYYLKSRYYDPEACRFISADDLACIDANHVNGTNLYIYSYNNPVMLNGFVYGNLLLIFTALSGRVLIGSKNSVVQTNGNDFDGISLREGSFRIPIWLSSLLTGADTGASLAPALRTLYQYIVYPGIYDINRLYGLDYVPGTLNTVCSVIGYSLLALNIGLSAWSNFTNDDLTRDQQWISFGVDTAYTLGSFAIGYVVGQLVGMIPIVGPFIAPFAAIGVTWLIEWSNEEWSWLDAIKKWLYDL